METVAAMRKTQWLTAIPSSSLQYINDCASLQLNSSGISSGIWYSEVLVSSWTVSSDLRPPPLGVKIVNSFSFGEVSEQTLFIKLIDWPYFPVTADSARLEAIFEVIAEKPSFDVLDKKFWILRKLPSSRPLWFALLCVKWGGSLIRVWEFKIYKLLTH